MIALGMSIWRRFPVWLLLLSIGVVFPVALAGQRGPVAPARFETVSIRLVPNNDVNGSIHGVGAVDPSLWQAHEAQVVLVIRAAYNMNFSDSTDDELILGTPAWVNNKEFDINARIPPRASRAQIPIMLQAMLADRFQFRAHWETRPLPAVAMMAAPGGLRLTRDRACESPDLPPRLLLSPGDRAAIAAEQAHPGCGASGGSFRDGTLTVNFHGYTMPRLAAYIGRNTIVVDRTGLTGAYDFTVSYPILPLRGAPRNQWDGISAQNQRELMEAYRKQLGVMIDLRRKVKLPVPVLVVDHIAMPSQN